MKKKVKFYQTKTFRNVVAIVVTVLMVVLLSHNVVGSTVSLFTEEYEPTEQAVIMPELQTPEGKETLGLKEEATPVVMAADELKQEDGSAQNSTEDQDAPMQGHPTAEPVVEWADDVTVEPQTDEDPDPYETPEAKTYETSYETPYEIPCETPDPTPEATKMPDLDSTVLIGLDQPDSGELMEEEFEEEAPIEDPFVEFPLDEELPTVERSVSVRRVISNIVRDGDLFQIEATLFGFDGIEYELQWQYNDGSGWQNVPDASGVTTLKLIADRYNVNYGWRILVSIVQR